MSLRSPLFYLIPDHTVEVAQAAFPKGNPYMRMRDTLGPIYTNPEFAHLFPAVGQPAIAPALLALITTLCANVHETDRSIRFVCEGEERRAVG